ncbi:uncharacterized protein AB675_1711 [Cyphellophora attinorum]|uniref:C3H1-type domain-containing protein n=1 Tax=Cyphellophora attinorum TaxID=1664694 RepID=A0A0N1P0M4_9EURO|nr:uncharacterized protein AB675_1711 [Phialophora attinorum]KPI43007.1 hypothetical protein AB675_1711 [Phialophora attinorum]
MFRPNRRKVVCKQFNFGYCSFGGACGFSSVWTARDSWPESLPAAYVGEAAVDENTTFVDPLPYSGPVLRSTSLRNDPATPFPRHNNDLLNISDIIILPTTSECSSRRRDYLPDRNMREPDSRNPRKMLEDLEQAFRVQRADEAINWRLCVMEALKSMLKALKFPSHTHTTLSLCNDRKYWHHRKVTVTEASGSFNKQSFKLSVEFTAQLGVGMPLNVKKSLA